MKLPAIGDLFARKYRIENVVGEGGFARVYGARVDGIGRRVAIKVLKPDGGGYVPTVVERFNREARIVAELRDPHTVTLHDCGSTEEGLLYMVYEYVEGMDLSELLMLRSKLAEAEATHILRQVLMSLREAHRAGLIHRDIKPSNIRLYEYLDDPMCVKLLDFGIAKPLEEFNSGLTKTGRVIGTPRYMSPEQITGEVLAPASDLYSLGLVTHEMLVGKAGRSKDFMSQVAITRSDEVSEELCRVVNRMLVKAPERRFQTAEEVLAALDAAERGPARQLEAQSGPQGIVLWAALALVFAVVAGLVLRMALRQAETAEMMPEQRIASLEPAPQIEDSATNEVQPVVPEEEEEEEPATREEEDLEEVHPAVNELDAGTTVPSPPATGCGNPPDVSRGSTLAVAMDGRVEKLRVRLPSTYLVSEPTPLLLFFTDGRFLQRGESDQGLAERLGMALVEVGKGDNPSEILAAARRGLCVDESRIYAIGSNAAADVALEASCTLPLAGLATSGLGEVGPRCEQGDVGHLVLVARGDKAVPRKPAWTCEQRDFVGLDVLMTQLAQRFGCEGGGKPGLASGCRTHTCAGAPLVTCEVAGGRPWNSTEAVSNSDRESCYGPASEGVKQGNLIREFFSSLTREVP